MASEDNKPNGIDDLVEKGLEILESEESLRDLKARKEFLSEVKRHGLALWRALVLYVYREHPNEQKRHIKTTPRKK